MWQDWLRKLQGLFGESPPPSAAQIKRKPFRTAEENAGILQLARVLSADDPELMTEVESSISDPAKYFQTYAAAREFASHKNEVDPLFAAYEALRRRQFLGSIDWRAEIDELKEAFQPLLQRQGLADFEWAFVDNLEQSEDVEALQNQNLLSLIGAQLRKRGNILVLLDMGWDSYDFAVLKPAAFEQVRGVKGEGFSVTDRFN